MNMIDNNTLLDYWTLLTQLNFWFLLPFPPKKIQAPKHWLQVICESRRMIDINVRHKLWWGVQCQRRHWYPVKSFICYPVKTYICYLINKVGPPQKTEISKNTVQIGDFQNIQRGRLLDHLAFCMYVNDPRWL